MLFHKLLASKGSSVLFPIDKSDAYYAGSHSANSYQNVVQKMPYATETWAYSNPMPVNRGDGTANGLNTTTMWLMGGAVNAGQDSGIERGTISTSTWASTGLNMTSSHDYGSGVQNLTTIWDIGGNPGSGTYSKLVMSTETLSSSSALAMVARNNSASVLIKGYIFTDAYNVGTTNTDVRRFDFSTESGTTLSGAMTAVHGLGAATTNGTDIWEGFGGSGSPGATISKFTVSTETGVVVGTASVSVSNLGASSKPNLGYFIGGSNPGNSFGTTQVTKITYSTNTIASSLPLILNGHYGCGY